MKEKTKKIIKKETKAPKTVKQGTEKKAKVSARAGVKTAAVSKVVSKALKGADKPKRRKAAEDTGSVDFQIDNFTQKINSLVKHLKSHPHDFDSRRGLLIMVGKRRRLLNYVKKNDLAKYEKLVGNLKLKKTIDKEEKK
jgi:small subunit ribosomal protein S15